MNERTTATALGPLGGPTGLGTSATRLASATDRLGLRRRVKQHSRPQFVPVGHLPLPDLCMPYPIRVSPHLDAARCYAVGWARRMGMFDSVPGVEAGAVWDERRFGGFDFAHCAAMIHAGASPEQLNLSSDWLAWGTYGDDYFPLVFGRTGNLAAAELCHERLPAFMPLDEGAAPEPASAIERGLADLWQRTAGPMPRPARERFRDAVLDMTGSWLWELANQFQNRIPDPVDYIEMRRKTFGSEMTMSLARLAHPDMVPEEIYQTRVVRELETAAQDYACFTNDLFSYQKEIEFDGEVHNLVLVVESFLDLDRLTARDIVADLMAERMRQFAHIIAHDLPKLFDDLAVDEPARGIISRHADYLKDWMSGILEWHRRTMRYTEAELLRRRIPDERERFSFLPTGLGTSAVRLAGKASGAQEMLSSPARMMVDGVMRLWAVVPAACR
jgi:germacradienol/geosmin synthase